MKRHGKCRKLTHFEQVGGAVNQEPTANDAAHGDTTKTAAEASNQNIDEFRPNTSIDNVEEAFIMKSPRNVKSRRLL